MDSKTDPKQVIPAADGGHGADEPWLGSIWSFAVIAAAEVALGAAVLRFMPAQPVSRHDSAAVLAAQAPQAAAQAALSDADRVSRWAAASGDAGRRPFVIVDKPHARVMAFDATGRLLSSAPVLLGLARGDDSVPGIGERPMAQIKPEERITPAGRFMAQPGVNLSGEDIVWVDYDAAVSMHRIRPVKASERRLERLASETIDDNRISYGCINLPPAFYERVLRPMVDAGPTVIYVLPDVRPLAEVFALGGKPAPARHAAL